MDMLAGPPRADWLAAYGALLATILGLVQVWQALRRRQRIAATYCFSSLESIGNTIILINHSEWPTTVYAYELFWARWRFFARRQPIVDDDDIYGFPQLPLAAYGTCELVFADERWFDWTHDFGRGRALFIRVKTAGRGRWLVCPVYRSPGRLRRRFEGLAHRFHYGPPEPL